MFSFVSSSLSSLNTTVSSVLAVVTHNRLTSVDQVVRSLGTVAHDYAKPYVAITSAALCGSLLVESLTDSNRLDKIRDLAASLLLGGLACSEGEDLVLLVEICGLSALTQLLIFFGQNKPIPHIAEGVHETRRTATDDTHKYYNGVDVRTLPRAAQRSFDGAMGKAFGPGGLFDRTFGPGGLFDRTFGRGGSFDRAFGDNSDHG